MNLSFWTKSYWIKKRAETEVGKKKKKKSVILKQDGPLLMRFA